MPKQFYRTVIQVEVLSEEPFQYDNLHDVNYAISQGDCSGKYQTVIAETIDGKTCAKLLLAQESDPSFFGLTDDGQGIDEQGEEDDDALPC